jgi:hypothetical protein
MTLRFGKVSIRFRWPVVVEREMPMEHYGPRYITVSEDGVYGVAPEHRRTWPWPPL